MLDEILTHYSIGRWRLPLLRLRPSLGLLALFLGISGLRAMAVAGALGVAPGRAQVGLPFFDQLTGAVAVWAAMPCVLSVVLFNPNPRGRWVRYLSTHLAGYLVFSVVQIALMFGLRALLGPPLGFEGTPRSLRFQLGWELQQDLMVYGGLAALLTAFIAWEERRVLSLRAAKLDARLSAARLAALSAQLDPHFLFNALNAVSQQMYGDPQVAEKLLADLGEILRATIEREGSCWTLAEEVAHARRYAGILEARFGERLEVDWGSTAGIEAQQVPRFSVQSLVENSVKHNADRLEPLHVRVGFQHERSRVCIVVEDDGRGFSPGSDPEGRGSDRLMEILELLYGEGGGLSKTAARSGGARVELWVPIEGAQ